MNSFLWILLQSMNSISSTIVSIFLSIFVWQETGDINFIYLYFLGLFVSIPFFGIIGAIISEKINFKLPFLISFLVPINPPRGARGGLLRWCGVLAAFINPALNTAGLITKVFRFKASLNKTFYRQASPKKLSNALSAIQ